MFDVEQQLEDWRTRFTRTEAMRGNDIEELEQHVRDSITTLMSKGLNAEEAFLIATRRVGFPAALDREFGTSAPRLCWNAGRRCTARESGLHPATFSDSKAVACGDRSTAGAAHNCFGHFCLAWKTATISRRSPRSL